MFLLFQNGQQGKTFVVAFLGMGGKDMFPASDLRSLVRYMVTGGFESPLTTDNLFPFTSLFPI